MSTELGPLPVWSQLDDVLNNMLRETVARGDTVAPGWRDEVRAVFRNMLTAEVAKERERCAKICDQVDKSTHPSDLADVIRNSKP